MWRYILIAFSGLLSAASFSQSGFNRLYDLEALEINRSVCSTDGFIYTNGQIGYTNSDYKHYVCKLDFDGNVIWEKRFRVNVDTMGYIFGLVCSKNGVLSYIGRVKTLDSYTSYFQQRSAIDGDSLLTVLYDTIGNTLILDLVEDTVFGGFYATGYTQNSLGDDVAVLLRLGPSGEYNWHKNYVIGQKTIGNSVSAHPDGGAIVSGYYKQSVNLFPWFFRTDTLGNMLWNKSLNFGLYSHGGANVIISRDSHIYIGTKRAYATNQGAGYYPRKAFLGKYTLSGQEVWTREYGRLWGVNENSDAYFGIRELNNGNIVGITNGFYKIPENATGGLITCAIQITPDGDSVWSKYYGYPPLGENTHYSWALDATDDGSFVTAGFVQPNDTGSQDMWVVKFDSNGCYDTVTDCVVGVEERSAFRNELSMWPNPVADVLNIEASESILGVQVMEVLGRVISYQPSAVRYHGEKQLEIDLRDLPEGVYLLRVETKGGTSISKFIKQ